MLVTYDTEPAKYRHWKLLTDGGPVARLVLDIQEDGGIRSGYKLKLNSYDLGVDIELNDAAQRLRFEHPEVKCVVVTSAKPRMFCSGGGHLPRKCPPHEIVARCRVANVGCGNLAGARGRGRFFTGVSAPGRKSGPHGIGVESLTARCEP